MIDSSVSVTPDLYSPLAKPPDRGFKQNSRSQRYLLYRRLALPSPYFILLRGSGSRWAGCHLTHTSCVLFLHHQARHHTALSASRHLLGSWSAITSPYSLQYNGRRIRLGSRMNAWSFTRWAGHDLAVWLFSMVVHPSLCHAVRHCYDDGVSGPVSAGHHRSCQHRG